MHTDIDAYRSKPWRLTGMTASERVLQLRRQIDNPDPNPAATTAAREAEERELIRLRTSDPQMFVYGDWRGTGRPAADRLYALQAGMG
jgi:hypothetical protein